MTWLEELFGTTKPIIAMAHFPPLPGTPLYDEKAGVKGIFESIERDLRRSVRCSVHLKEMSFRSGQPGRVCQSASRPRRRENDKRRETKRDGAK